MKFKVSRNNGGWYYGYNTLEDAKVKALWIWDRTGVVAAIVSYRTRQR